LSGICGLFNTDGRPVERENLARLSDAARHPGPDGINSWNFENVGLTQMLMATTLEAAEETRPFFHQPSKSCIVFDGRLDNRHELIGQLNSGEYRRLGNSDMELVLLAWLRWGVESPAHLLGDFAFAIHDGREHRLFCARDTSAVKPFYYSFKSNRFSFGSTIAQVLAGPGVSTRPNEGMIAEMLSTNITSRVETIYKDILRLPAGHYLLVDRDQCRLGRYWQMPAQSRIRYANLDDYAAHFEEIFTESVRCRLRCKGTVGVTLSGGKDSPSVAGMAQSLLAESGCNESLKSFSVTFPGRVCDEAHLIRDVVSKWGLDAHYYPFDKFRQPPDWAAQVDLTGDLPEVPTLSWLTGAKRSSVEAGTTVWLSGSGSDCLLGGSHFGYLSMLLDGKAGYIAREFNAQREDSGFKFAALHLLASLSWPMLPRAIKKNIQQDRHQAVNRGFLTEGFYSSSHLAQRVLSARNAEKFNDLAAWSNYRGYFSGRRTHGLESDDSSNAFAGIEERHPFLDQRLVEFAFAVPEYVKRWGNRDKLLLLHLGERLLPLSVLNNEDKTEVGCVFLDVLCREPVREIFHSLHSADMGWVSQRAVRADYESLYRIYKSEPMASHQRFGAAYAKLYQLWMILAFEVWLSRSRSRDYK
jgi:asparagine synthase (glutamine-hydrolysing)